MKDPALRMVQKPEIHLIQQRLGLHGDLLVLGAHALGPCRGGIQRRGQRLQPVEGLPSSRRASLALCSHMLL